MPSRVVSLAGLVLTAAALLTCLGVLLSACGSRRGEPTPEALVAEFARRLSRGDYDSVWDLYTRESREKFVQDIAITKDTLERNPGARVQAARYNLTWEEFRRLSAREIFVAEARGRERWMEGYLVEQVHPDPVQADLIVAVVDIPGPYKAVFKMRHVPGEGYLVEETGVRQ